MLVYRASLAGGLLVASLGLPAFAAELIVPTGFATIAEAIAEARDNGDGSNTIIVEPGTYSVNLELISNLTLRGRETARTFLRPLNEATAMIRASDISGARVSNFIFLPGATTDRGTGIMLDVNAGVRVSNNVFRLGAAGTGVSVVSGASADAEVENNVFFGNETGLTQASDQVLVRNNIFADNATAISPSSSILNIDTNGFFGNTADGTRGSNAIGNTGDSADFVDAANNDFHLLAGSPAIDAGIIGSTDSIDGTDADLGAYGGSDADPRPFPVQALRIISTADTSVRLGWARNPAYRVTGYRIHFGAASGNYTEPVVDVGDVTEHTVTDLAVADPDELPSPEGLTLTPANRTLRATWTALAGASGYQLHYGVASTAENTVEVGNVTAFDLTGLENGTTYRVSVTALSQSDLFFAVGALDGDGNESALVNELRVPLGEPRPSLPSAEVTDFPEFIVAHPALPDEGCFIATAAFGYYDAAQVQALRDFRDRFLLGNRAGRAFVGWYYRESPAAARWLNAHAQLKPLVRALLAPAVWLAEALTGRSPWPLFGVLLALSLAPLWHWRQRARRAVACA